MYLVSRRSESSSGSPALAGPSFEHGAYVERRPFLETQAVYYQASAVAGHLHRPNARWEHEWPEHPLGRIVLETNNLGFREGLATQAAAPPGVVRILITGDSHTDGVVWNRESFPNLLESELNGAGGRQFEVINGGVGYYGPFN